MLLVIALAMAGTGSVLFTWRLARWAIQIDRAYCPWGAWIGVILLYGSAWPFALYAAGHGWQ